MINIFYNNKPYGIKNLDLLAEEAPFFKPAISFIKNWMTNTEKFDFQSSGSTGVPKMLDISRKQILSSVELTRKYLQLKQGEKALVCLSPEYIATKMMIARCLVLGLDIVLVEPCANPLDRVNISTKIDFASFVPMQVQKILDSVHSARLSKIRNVLIGGAGVHNSLINKLKNFNNKIYHTYGMTETVSHVALRKLDKNSQTNHFTCLSEVHIRTDENDCLVVSGPMTDHKEIFTKDLIEIHNQNEFTWKGRLDNLVNSGGVKIIPELVEEQLISIFRRSNLSNEFFLAGIEDPLLGQKLVLLIEGGHTDKTLDSLNENMRKFLPKYHIPKEVIFKKEFIRTASGKVRRMETLKSIE